ncbi:unnamed protein product [Closterium sp. NIES-54]
MSVIGVGADEELAIGAGAVLVAFTSVGVAAAPVVSAAADVDAVAVVSTPVFCVVLQDCLLDVKSSLPIVQLELLSGAVGFKVNPFCYELADA